MTAKLEASRQAVPTTTVFGDRLDHRLHSGGSILGWEIMQGVAAFSRSHEATYGSAHRLSVMYRSRQSRWAYPTCGKNQALTPLRHSEMTHVQYLNEDAVARLL